MERINSYISYSWKKTSHIIWLSFAASMFLSFFAVNNQTYVFFAASYVLMAIGMVFNPFFPLCIYLSISPFIPSGPAIFTFIYYGLIFLPLLITTIKKRTGFFSMGMFGFFSLSFLFLSLSFIFGKNPNFTTLIVQVFLLALSIVLATHLEKEGIFFILASYAIRGVVMLVIIAIDSLRGQLVILWDYRLSYNGSVRTLSNSMIVSAFLFFYLALFAKQIKKTRRMFFLLLFFAELGVLLLSYSRGVIISLIIAVLLLYLFRKNQTLSLKILIIISSALLLFFFAKLLNVDNERMIGNITSLSGRNDIWETYTRALFSNSIPRILFGFGPGVSSRVIADTSFSSFYSHSLFIDMLVCYGVVGFVWIVCSCLFCFYQTLRFKNYLAFSVLTLVILQFVSHGNIVEFDFYVLLPISVALAKILAPKNQFLPNNKSLLVNV